ncbi:aspartyl-phosphate phosphatase Spo0E family protein [Ammoniphilus sp. 3BR4]|uniref:aspartyl-phosphate phosphatase Spo0E family protein n=1 Tax=Ammoniphilus sp. 3BR4 TaxID=3158265 RepID=UPI003466D74E
MLLYKLTHLSEQINNRREAMYELVEKRGLTDQSVIQASQDMDGLIVEFQKIVAYLRQQGDQMHTSS